MKCPILVNLPQRPPVAPPFFLLPATHVIFFAIARKTDISCALSTGHGLDQRPWRCPWFAPGAHLAIIPPPGVIRFGSGRLLFLGRGLPGSYGLNGNRARNLLPNNRPTAIANL